MMSNTRRRKCATVARSTIALAVSLAVVCGTAHAQKAPADPTQLPPTPTDYTPKKTPWGDWDFSGTWPYDYPPSAQILFQRPKGYGNRIWLTADEHAKRLTNATKSDASYAPDKPQLTVQTGTQGLAAWIKNSGFAWRTSLLVNPRDGQLPALTPQADALFKAGRSGWVPKQSFDWVDDFDTWDRCITRGFPASMFPNRYNNSLRVFQSPGYVTIVLEMLGRRVIPIVSKADVGRHWPANVEAWMGDSRAYWEGKTLIIDTTNIKSGDSVTHDTLKRAAAPVIVTMIGGAPRNTIPTSTKAHTIEKLTMTGPNAILYEITYNDPEVFTAPWTAQLEWTRDESYVMPEYACHEGDIQIRNYISASRATRAAIARGELDPNKYSDGNERFDRTFDVDPVAPGAVVPPPRGAPATAPAAKKDGAAS
jgi:hypothetical protein